MTKQQMQWRIGLCAFGVSIGATVFAADIYRSEGADGSVRYASTVLDPTYVLFLKNEEPTAVIPKPQRPLSIQQRSARARFDPLLEQNSIKYAVDLALVRAVVEVESAFQPHVVSPAGATGLMQLMPATAARYGVVDRTDPAQNIEAGIHYLKDLLTLHNGNVVLALASYSAGQNAVIRHGRRIPPYKETMLYVAAVLAKRQAAEVSINP